MQDWYLYLVRCCDDSLYTGVSTDVDRWFTEHKENKGLGARYLRGRGPLSLVYQRKLGSKRLALAVESRVKKLSKVQKEELVNAGKHIDEIIEQVEG